VRVYTIPRGGFPKVRTDQGKVLTQDEIQSNSIEYNQKLIELERRVLQALVLQGSITASRRRPRPGEGQEM
jgi:hypothetical protein